MPVLKMQEYAQNQSNLPQNHTAKRWLKQNTPSSFHPSIPLSFHLSIQPSIRLSIHLSIHSSVHLSIHLLNHL